MLNAQIFAFADTMMAMMLASGFLAVYLIDRKFRTLRWWAGAYMLLGLSFVTVINVPGPKPIWTETVAWILLYASAATAAFGMHAEGENRISPRTPIVLGALLLAIIDTILILTGASHAGFVLWGAVPTIALALWSAWQIVATTQRRRADMAYAGALAAGTAVIAIRAWWFSQMPSHPLGPTGLGPVPLAARPPPGAFGTPIGVVPGPGPITQPLLLSFLTILSLVALAVALVFRTSLKQVNQMRERSTTDGMTGLLNRATFDELTAQVEAAEAATPVCVVVLDVDHFKQVNDTRGHPEGDRVIACLGEIIRDAADASHIAGRIGGEEFAVILTGVNTGAARLFAEAVRTRFAACEFGGDEPFNVTLSAGIAARRDGETLRATIARADEALYAAKKAGRDRVMIAASHAAPARHHQAQMA